MARITHGDFLGLGEKVELVPVKALGAPNFVVLPSPVEPRDLGKHQLVRTE